jgi:hypothetical protein
LFVLCFADEPPSVPELRGRVVTIRIDDMSKEDAIQYLASHLGGGGGGGGGNGGGSIMGPPVRPAAMVRLTCSFISFARA